MEYYLVYVKADEQGRIIAINSSEFLQDVTGWVQVDEGVGDRYHHAQGNYLPNPIVDDRGVYRYKLAGGQVVERTQEEMDADWVEPEPVPTDKERIAALEKDNADLKEALELLLSGVTG